MTPVSGAGARSGPPAARTLLCLGLLLCGCRGEQPAREAATPPAASTVPVDTASVAASTPAPDSVPAAAPGPAPSGPRQDTAVVRSLTDGDRGCYVVLEDERGERFDRIAPFELCERRELVGRRARITFGPGAVAADSCQGSPECTESDTVEVLKSAEALP